MKHTSIHLFEDSSFYMCLHHTCQVVLKLGLNVRLFSSVYFSFYIQSFKSDGMIRATALKPAVVFIVEDIICCYTPVFLGNQHNQTAQNRL